MKDNGTWNKAVIRRNFVLEVAEAILRIVLAQEEDKLIWKPKRNGSYSVQSSYRLAFSFSHPPIETFPSYCANKALWRSVWSFKILPKIKVFVWKLIHERIPVRQKLKAQIPHVDD